MKSKIFFALLLNMPLFTEAAFGYANDPGGKLLGIILDQESNVPIEYATISVFSRDGNQLITGTISNQHGKFSIPDLKEGQYIIRINSLTYKEHVINAVNIAKNKALNLGKVYMKIDIKQLEEIVVTSETNSIDYQIDRKVVAVDKQLSAASLTAVEALENVPSVTVDIEGNVLLRGNPNFSVFIDGKPTALSPTDALRQIPASTILNIEIITNPSSKYIPDGTAGIINVITKKSRNNGLGGIANAGGGSFGMYNGNLLLNYRQGKFNWYVGGDLAVRIRPSKNYSERRTTLEETVTTVISNGENRRTRGNWSVRGGWDWDITEKDVFSTEFRIGNFRLSNRSNLNYSTDSTGTQNTILETTNAFWQVNMRYFNITGNYQHTFANEKETLSMQVNYSSRNPDEVAESTLLNSDKVVTNGSKITEKGPISRWNIRLDYSKPVGKGYTLEAGSQFRLAQSRDELELYRFNTATNTFIVEPDKQNGIDYKRNIYSVYAVFKGNLGGKLKDLGFQAGLRSEYTDRTVRPNASTETFAISQLNFFPSIYLSYKLPKQHQLMANYSRRIERPRGWYFEPFIVWTDLFNVRQGNPNIVPEFIDLFEVNYLKNWKKNSLSLETYYRITHNKIDRIRSVYEEQNNVILTRFYNVGTDYSIGIEGMYTIKNLKWWEINMSGNVYGYRIRGQIEDRSFNNESFNWTARWNNMFKVYKTVTLQVTGQYNSSSASAQGRENGYYTINSGAKVSFLNKTLSLSFQVRDIFATGRRTSTVTNENLYNYNTFLVNAPQFSVNVSYRLNRFRPKKRQHMEENSGDDL